MNLTFWNIDRFCARVNLESESPVIDLSDVTFVEPFALVYLGMFLRHHNSQGRFFDVRFPESYSARKYLARQNFWQRFNFNPSMIRQENLYRLTSTTSLNDIVDIERRDWIAEDVASAVLQILSANVESVQGDIIAELVSELVDNFAQHSGRTLAAFAMQYYPNGNKVVCAIGDCGIGIRASLISNPNHSYLASRPHYDCAIRAFEPLISRKREGGTSLTEVRDGVLDLGGRLILTTRDGFVIIDENQTRVGTMDHNLAGVQVEMSIPVSRT